MHPFNLSKPEEDDRPDGDHRFRLLVESVKDYAIFMLDVGGNITSWNVGASRIKGYDAAEIVGKHFSVFYPPGEIAAGKCEKELAIATAEGRFQEEGWRVRKDGSQFWASVVISAIHSPDGTLLGFAKVTQDLTARLEAERERATALQREAASRRKDDFLAVLSHELRNPIASIVATSDRVSLRGGLATEAEMAIIGRQARHMTRLVDDLLDASRALREDVVLSRVPLEMAAVVAEAIELVQPMLKAQGHVLTAAVPNRGLLVNVDLGRFAQVFGNLFSNAAKFTPPGGRIHVSASATDDTVSATVEDSGEGIAPELLGHVFEPFVQGEQGLDRKKGGLGIGLAIARKLVHAHDGEITAESSGQGRGSRMTVRLPRVGALPAAASGVAPALARRRILVVDDNEDFVESLVLLLESLGHDARGALDGARGIAAALELLPELILLDIGLPDASGYEIVGRLRRVPACATIPIIAVSGYARATDCAMALAAGFTAHIAKPIDIGQIKRALGDAFAGEGHKAVA